MRTIVLLAGIVTLWVGGIVVANRRHARNLRTLAEQRRTETLPIFLASFEGATQTLAVAEAAYGALQAELSWIVPEFPLHPSDELETTLCIGKGEVDGIVDDQSVTFGRRPEPDPANPYVGKVQTVADLVRYIAAQPVAN